MRIDTRPIKLSDSPGAIAVSPSGDRVYLAYAGAGGIVGSWRRGAVAIVDPNALQPNARAELARIRVGRTPSAIAVDPGGERIYVTNVGSGDVSVVDVQSASEIARIKVGKHPSALVYVDRLYVANAGANTVSVVDPQTGPVLTTVVTGKRPWCLVASPSRDRVYVLNKADGTVSTIDTRSLATMATVAVGRVPVDMALDPTGTRLYVANLGSQSLTVVDTEAFETVQTIRLTTLSTRTGVGFFRDPVSPQPWAIGVSRDGERLLIAFWEAGTLAILNAKTGSRISETQLDNAKYSIGPIAIAEDWANRRLYVSCADHALVTVRDD